MYVYYNELEMEKKYCNIAQNQRFGVTPFEKT